MNIVAWWIFSVVVGTPLAVIMWLGLTWLGLAMMEEGEGKEG